MAAHAKVGRGCIPCDQVNSEPFAVQPLAGCGLGCVALTDVPRGTRLLAERPLTLEGPGLLAIEKTVAALSAAEHATFFDLAQDAALFGESTPKSIEGIIGTNGIPFTAADGREFGAIFPRAARINHSCDANAIYAWHDGLRRLTVHAARPIRRGEEITFNYSCFDRVFCPRDERRRRLRENFGFACACRKCALTGAALAASEARIAEIGDDEAFIASLASWDGAHAPAAPVLATLERRYELMCHECPDGHYTGSDRLLRVHVEFCDGAAQHAAALLAREPPEGARREALRVTFVAMREAAERWARVAREVARDVAGEDAPCFVAWTAALERGCWRGDDVPGRPTFASLWAAAHSQALAQGGAGVANSK